MAARRLAALSVGFGLLLTMIRLMSLCCLCRLLNIMQEKAQQGRAAGLPLVRQDQELSSHEQWHVESTRDSSTSGSPILKDISPPGLKADRSLEQPLRILSSVLHCKTDSSHN